MPVKTVEISSGYIIEREKKKFYLYILEKKKKDFL